MATLTDVAKKANVSKMTVSRVINHPEKVTDELKEAVYKAMKELNYTPNSIAQALARNRTNVVKVVILEEMDVVEPYYMTLLTGIAQELNLHQYAVRLLANPEQDDGEADGYIITGMRERDYEWIKSLEKPIILYGENNHHIDFVDTNNQKAISMATEYALSRYENCVYIGIDVDERFELQREKGFMEEMDKAGKSYTIHRVKNRSSKAKQYVEKLLEIGVPKNTCFICSTDRIGLGVTRALREKQHSIPQDFGVIGFDGVFLDRIASPRLTTIKQPLTEMGRACADELLKKIKYSDYQSGENYFQAQLVIAESTK
ncbi:MULTISPECIES: LacI family DNA-binding transcriptional regulator [unclassified Granulicatella]|uniref:LacI family DNA-binding transcriptional regulator n=1 Tax=unclassified Granulicatella TaxID=2630493 RepID=UPI001073C391|nr:MULTISPECIES: LacI family DNA-binding transcriptional regulator [unclassified Granulicatella]MBF0779655.1 LacI family DNA-binding transcriptional regulator [Granulicatella sp. 19428wC4_WM01]TFU96311.1 LacI family transcriptional regulator [Granulicatella sp. WM01]